MCGRPVVSENFILVDSRDEAESAHHPVRCLRSSNCSGRSSPTCSGRGVSLKSRTSFSGISSILPCGVYRTIGGFVGVTEHCWYGRLGSGQACSIFLASFSVTRSCDGIEPGFGRTGAGNLALGQGGPQLAVSCASSSDG